jgi:hypothetical protein
VPNNLISVILVPGMERREETVDYPSVNEKEGEDGGNKTCGVSINPNHNVELMSLL